MILDMDNNRTGVKIDVKKDNRKLTTGVFLRTIFAAVLNFIILMSIIALSTAVATRNIGTDVYEMVEGGGTTAMSLVTHIPNEATTTAQSTSTTTQVSGTESGTSESGDTSDTADTSQSTAAQVRMPHRSDMTPFAAAVSDIIAQLLMVILLLSMPYSVLWAQGDKDANHVQFGHMAENKLRGLKIGAVAALPSILPFIMLVLIKLSVIPDAFIILYRFLNVTYWPLMSLITGGNAASANIDNYGWLTVIVLLLVQGLLPLISHAAYTLGYKHISLVEKFIYVNPNKKKKRRR